MKANVRKVMIVDDNEFDCYITSKIITHYDASLEIMEFNSSVTAIEYLEEFQNEPSQLPEFIFLDIYMPVLDGFGFIAKFNALSAVVKQHAKICILSTTVDDLYIHKAKVSESVLFSSKPITKEFVSSIF